MMYLFNMKLKGYNHLEILESILNSDIEIETTNNKEDLKGISF